MKVRLMAKKAEEKETQIVALFQHISLFSVGGALCALVRSTEKQSRRTRESTDSEYVEQLQWNLNLNKKTVKVSVSSLSLLFIYFCLFTIQGTKFDLMYSRFNGVNNLF